MIMFKFLGIGESCVLPQDCFIDPSISTITPECKGAKCTCPEDISYPAAKNSVCQANKASKKIRIAVDSQG